jgi:hypothetical protein
VRCSIDQEVGLAEHCGDIYPELLRNHAESTLDPVEDPLESGWAAMLDVKAGYRVSVRSDSLAEGGVFELRRP